MVLFFILCAYTYTKGEVCMLYANDEIFNIGYNAELDRLEIKNKRKNNKLRKIFNENKLITTLMILFVAFSVMNCVLIYTFMELLKNI